jgi:hypothetical protein
MRTPTPTQNKLTPRHCADLMGLARHVRVHCSWMEKPARCTAIMTGSSASDAVARLRRVWEIPDHIQISATLVNEYAGGAR